MAFVALKAPHASWHKAWVSDPSVFQANTRAKVKRKHASTAQGIAISLAPLLRRLHLA